VLARNLVDLHAQCDVQQLPYPRLREAFSNIGVYVVAVPSKTACGIPSLLFAPFWSSPSQRFRVCNITDLHRHGRYSASTYERVVMVFRNDVSIPDSHMATSLALVSDNRGPISEILQYSYYV